MQFKFKKIVILWILLSLVSALFASTALAASASASASPSTVTVGSKVTVKVTFSGKNIGAVGGSFSYDSSVLRFDGGSGLSNGGISLVGPPASSISGTATFTALKAGSTTINFSANEIFSHDTDANGNEISLGSASASVKVTVSAPATTNPDTNTPSKPSIPTKPNTTTKTNTSTNEQKPVEVEKPNPLEQAIQVTVGDLNLLMWKDLSTVKLPDGFKIGEGTYKEEKLQVAAAVDREINLAYLTDQEGKNGKFFVLDSKSDSIYPYITISTSSSYISMKPDSSTPIPEGYKETEITLSGQSVQAWVAESGDNPDFYLIYAMNSKGIKGFYIYDQVDGTIQRFTDRTVIVEVEKEPEAKTFFQRLTSDPTAFTIVGGLGALSVTLLILLMVSAAKFKKIK